MAISSHPYPPVSVCIVSWNVWMHLKQCLTHLLRDFSEFQLEVIVVDNHSTDGSAGMVKTHFPNVRLIENTHNAGFAQAANQAIRAASHETIFLLNPDTIANPEALRMMIETLLETPQCGLVSCALLGGDGSDDSADATSDFTPFKHQYWPLVACAAALVTFAISPRFERLFATQYSKLKPPVSSKNKHTKPHEVGSVSGCAWVFTKSVFDRVGGFDERFFFTQEDVDFCLRARALGLKVMLCPNVHIIHYVNQSLNRWDPSAKLSMLTFTRYQFIRKYQGRMGLTLRVAALVSSRLIVALCLRLTPHRTDIRMERDAVLILRYRCYGIDGFDVLSNYARVMLGLPHSGQKFQ